MWQQCVANTVPVSPRAVTLCRTLVVFKSNYVIISITQQEDTTRAIVLRAVRALAVEPRVHVCMKRRFERLIQRGEPVKESKL